MRGLIQLDLGTHVQTLRDYPMTTSTTTVRDLRRQWKPHKERLGEIRSDHPTAVRFHRAFSRLDQAEKLDPDQDSDLVLIQQWVALNALYGTWDEEGREPTGDRPAWKSFLERILSIDEAEYIRAVLVEHKQLVLAILGNAYLNRHYWQEPREQSMGRFRSASRRAHSWYFEKRWLIIMEQFTERIYLLRCQIIHGAATCGSRLNRDALRRCTRMMELLNPAILRVWIENGVDEDWGPLCYPPIPDSASRHRNRSR